MEYHFHYGTPCPRYMYSRYGHNILPQMRSKLQISNREIRQSLQVNHAPISNRFYGRGDQWLSAKYKPYQSRYHRALTGGGTYFEAPAHNSYLFASAPFRDDMFLHSDELQIRTYFA